MNDELPEGWAVAKLGHLVQPSAEKVEPQQMPPEFPYLSLEHIAAGTTNIVGHGAAAEAKSTKTRFRRGDLLYGKLRPYLNKVCIPDFDGICSTDILVFVGNETLDLRYLLRFLTTPEVVAYANHHSTGVQLPRIGFEALGDLDLPLPPLAEQQRIAEKVEALFSRVNAARERLNRVLTMIKLFREAVLTAACSGRLTEEWRGGNTQRRDEHTAEDDWTPPQSWVSVALGDVLLHIEAGRSFACLERPPVDNEVGVVKVSAVSWGVYDERESKTCVDAAKINPKLFVQSGDFLFSRANTIELVGACVIAEHVTRRIMLSDKILRLRLHSVRPRWVLNVLRSTYGRREIERLATGNQQSMRNIGQERMRQIQIPLPPDREQREIILRVDALMSLADAVEARVRNARARAEKLPQAMLAKAFAAELVPTEAELARREGREYESASVLLERIRAQREGKGKEKVGRSRARVGRFFKTKSANGSENVAPGSTSAATDEPHRLRTSRA